MSTNRQPFLSMKERFGKRLRTARNMAGLSQDGLVEAIGGKVSKNAISKYERGEMLPDQEVMDALAEALGVKSAYFFRPFKVEIREVAFRKDPSLSKEGQDRLKGITSDILERYLELEELLGIASSFENPLSHLSCNDFNEAKTASRELRERWELGLNPIPNVLEMLEEKEIKVVEFEGPEGFDALSTYVQGLPVIVLEKGKEITNTRKRFNALHELGHLLLNIPDTISHKRTEQLCHAFASELLIPEKALEEWLGKRRKNISISELVELKKYYGISIQAIVYRAQKAKIIPQTVAKRFWERRDADPALEKEDPEAGYGEYKSEERSYRFMNLICRAASEEVVSMSKAADLAGMKLSNFREKFLAL